MCSREELLSEVGPMSMRVGPELVSQEEFGGMNKRVLRILWEDLEDEEGSPPHPRVCYTGRRNGMLAWVIKWRKVGSSFRREEFFSHQFSGVSPIAEIRDELLTFITRFVIY